LTAHQAVGPSWSEWLTPAQKAFEAR
jgi:hypothetical protein